MSRPMLAPEKISPAVTDAVAKMHRDTVDEVASAVARDHIVVVGMKQNPVVKKARQLLATKGLTYTYLEYGSYLGEWRRRLAIKLWAGFPTFPMVFVDGTLVGGNAELQALAAEGKLA